MNRRSLTYTLILIGLCAALLWISATVSQTAQVLQERDATLTVDTASKNALTATGNFEATVQRQFELNLSATAILEALVNTQMAAIQRTSVVATLAAGGGTNDLWTPVTRDFSGVSMVLVPAGCFLMGSDRSDAEKPINEVCFKQPFWIDRTEVTLVQFKVLGGKKRAGVSGAIDFWPVDEITWVEARDFCVLRGVRLPTEAEWEYAARGPEGLTYPWGNFFGQDNVSEIAEVGSRPSGASWVGALDMSGNVREWVSSLYQPYPYNANDGREADTGGRTDVERVVRGIEWRLNEPVSWNRATSRMGLPPHLWGYHLGFRCAGSFDRDSSLTVSTPTRTAITAVSRGERRQSTSTPTHTAITPAAPIPSGMSNSVWMPQIQDFNGVIMVLVPAGCFKMGSENGDSDEKPVHKVCLDQPFWIDQTEVTQAQFKSFGGKAAYASYFKGNNLPVEQITWFEARDFCAVRGAHLPTEAEWEYAARGPEGLIYPWGNTIVANNAVYSGNSNGETANVGSRPGGVSWVGALDMSGNVWEWVSGLYQPYPYKANDERESTSDTNSVRMLRGGSWGDFEFNLRAANRHGNTPQYGDNLRGFRCARSYN